MKGGNEASKASGITHRQALRLPNFFNHKEHKETNGGNDKVKQSSARTALAIPY